MTLPGLRVEVLDADGADRSAEFEVGIELRDPDGPGSGRRADVRVVCRAPKPVEASIRVSASVPSADPWWLIAGAFSGENRPAGNSRVFPRFETGADTPAYRGI